MDWIALAKKYQEVFGNRVKRPKQFLMYDVKPVCVVCYMEKES